MKHSDGTWTNRNERFDQKKKIKKENEDKERRWNKKENVQMKKENGDERTIGVK